MNAEFYDDFLTELKALDDFLAYRAGAERHVQREDPDVRRLMESLAFFSTRTRDVASSELRYAVHRLARGHLDDFMTPQPARGLLRAQPTPRLVDAQRMPRGTRVRLETVDGDVGLFTTMRDVTIRPLELDWAELQLRGGAGFRILIRVRSRGVSGEITEPLSFHVSALDDYEASLRFHYLLRRHQRAVSVCYDTIPEQGEVGAPCEFGFGGGAGPVGTGAVAPDVAALVDVSGKELSWRPAGTVAGIREFFHFPHTELYLDIAMAVPEKRWRQAWLCLDLDARWPTEQVVNRDMFRLFTVPIENLLVDNAEPIMADGTKASYPIRSTHPERQVALHSVIEVTQEKASGRDVILPAHLTSGDESYDVEYLGDSEDRPEQRLILRLPDAFTQPRPVVVRARWYQPWFDVAAVGKLTAALQTRHIEGVEFQVQGQLTPHRTSPLWRDSAAMLRVLSRRSKRILSRRDIISLMATLGADATSYHGDVAGDLLHVEAREEPADFRRGGVKYIYRVTVAEVEDERVGLLVDYLVRVERLLDSWSGNPVEVETRERVARERKLLTGTVER